MILQTNIASVISGEPSQPETVGWLVRVAVTKLTENRKVEMYSRHTALSPSTAPTPQQNRCHLHEVRCVCSQESITAGRPRPLLMSVLEEEGGRVTGP